MNLVHHYTLSNYENQEEIQHYIDRLDFKCFATINFRIIDSKRTVFDLVRFVDFVSLQLCKKLTSDLGAPQSPEMLAAEV